LGPACDWMSLISKVIAPDSIFGMDSTSGVISVLGDCRQPDNRNAWVD